MSPWEKLLERPHSRGHYVQLYETDEASLAKNAGYYLWEGLRRGDGALIIATPEHEKLFCQHLNHAGADLAALLGSQQLVFADARHILAQFIAGGQPNWRRFESVIQATIRQVRPRKGAEGLRAYGEMVGILWKERQFSAALRLEQLWNKLLERASFSLYCAYAIDIFGKDFDVANLDGVLCAHTHLIPTQPDGMLETALNRSVDEVLGQKAEALRSRIKTNYRPSSAVMPTAEAMVLWLKTNLPEQSAYIRARARHHYHLLLHPPGSTLRVE